MNFQLPRLFKVILPALAAAALQIALPWELCAQDAPARHCLWKVENGTNTLYLLGSFHLLKAGDYPLAAPLESAFSNAQVVAFETDIEEMEQAQTQMKMMTRSTLPPDETLKDELSAETYTALTNHLSDVGLPLMLLEHLKPSMAAALVEVSEMQKLGMEADRGVDKHFYHQAKEAGKTIVPLETVDFQIGLMTDFSKEEGEMLVKSTLSEIDDTKKEFTEMVTAWKTGDAPKLEKLLNDAMRESPAIYRRLLTDRNERWIPKLQEFLNSGKTAVVIVGAGHLVGDQGVAELLREKGMQSDAALKRHESVAAVVDDRNAVGRGGGQGPCLGEGRTHIPGGEAL